MFRLAQGIRPARGRLFGNSYLGQAAPEPLPMPPVGESPIPVGTQGVFQYQEADGSTRIWYASGGCQGDMGLAMWQAGGVYNLCAPDEMPAPVPPPDDAPPPGGIPPGGIPPGGDGGLPGGGAPPIIDDGAGGAVGDGLLRDPDTGFLIDPNTGRIYDPATGAATPFAMGPDGTIFDLRTGEPATEDALLELFGEEANDVGTKLIAVGGLSAGILVAALVAGGAI